MEVVEPTALEVFVSSAVMILFCIYILGELITDGEFYAHIKAGIWGLEKGSPCIGATKSYDENGTWHGRWTLPDGRHYTDPNILIQSPKVMRHLEFIKKIPVDRK